MLEQSETSYFSEPSASLDPRLFRDDKMQSSVRSAILQLLFNHLNQNYTGGEAWSRVWLAGSGVSYQWAAHRDPGDLDCLVVVDYRRFRESNNRYAGLSDKEIADMLNEGIRHELHPITTRFLDSFELTFYAITSPDITDIKPYAAYSLTDDDWTVAPEQKPLVVPMGWKNYSDSDRIQTIKVLTNYKNAKDKYEAASNEAIKANARSEMRMAMAQAVAMYEGIHSDRSNAFSATGEGYSDFANYRWQAGKQSGVIQGLRAIKDEMDAEDEALQKSTYGVDLPDANTLIRRAATYRNH
ncbi:hypothetical protein UFOVP115_84 [uncultured Caudovirales phage]|uniref:Nucleotidyltransferase n=1 Tax=uncultured Caudovirales phage TaxID=2100421 RepID=A0A6J5L4K6_9CAUD|nr:hypothetical protein UFOVP115_84 [uncultured Caudovirales phage]